MPAVFAKVPQELDFPREEAAVLALWKERRVFARSLENAGPDAPTFVFYEGPPTANGLPHNGHVLTRVFKDIFPRYKTMRGYRVPRKAGWDTHGLPVEVEVEKSLRIHGKAAIEEYGVEPFIARCVQSVFRYTEEWERLTERIGFWVDLPTAYVTYHRSYVESVWWALSELFAKGLLYQGHKVVWWWAQGGTALSSAEVGEGYRTVDDPSAYVAFPLAGEDAALLVWTTTPWTLPSNMYAAVNPTFEYAYVEHGGRTLVVAAGLVEELGKKLKTELAVKKKVAGADLVGKRYAPPFDFVAGDARYADAWRVIGADFVTLDAGTGVVHVAPAFGEDDFNAFRKLGGKELVCLVRPDGTFDERAGAYAGRWVKDTDKDIQKELEARGLLVHAEVYRHDYPFCVRADDDPLIQYARPAWYIRTTARIDQAIANNRAVSWLPPHIKEGRFGDFLANNVDWALSRERYWGTPLNVWVNDVTGKMECPPSTKEILAKNPDAFRAFEEARAKDPTLSEHLVVHKPWIDYVTWQNPGEPGTYRRVPEVIDVWFDSGCMPFAQFGFPHAGVEAFREAFPADFISEAIDQTRGWFYSLLMVSTLVFDEATQARYGLRATPYPYPYKTCIVLGHVQDREGKKESKSKGNYTPPEVILDKVALDFAVQPEDAPEPGVVLVAREDLEGLDLLEGAKVRATGGAGGDARDLVMKVGKKLRRRHAVLHASDRAALGLTPAPGAHDKKPNEIGRLEPRARVTLEDTTQPPPGADAFRWFFFASNPPWSNTRHSLSNVRALQKEFLVKLRNVWSFFVIYANIDGFDPHGAHAHAPAPTSELDRFALSELALTVRGVTADLDAFDVYAATQRLSAFVEALSNWYVRRSRERFWASGWSDDKASAYATLYDCLVTIARASAPFVPFLAEAMYQNLVHDPARRRASVPQSSSGAAVVDSVHLTAYPEADATRMDEALSAKMSAVRALVSLGLQVRTTHKLKVRQPLRAAHLVLSRPALADELAKATEMIREELNVLTVSFVPRERTRDFVEYKLKPNFRTLGARGLGRQAQELKKTMAALSAEEAARLHAALAEDGRASAGGVELLPEDVEVAFETKPGFAAAGDRLGVVVLETALDEELKDLGFVRELQFRLQALRKERGLEYTDRVAVTIDGSERVKRILDRHGEGLAREVLAAEFVVKVADVQEEDVVEGERVRLRLERRAPSGIV